MTTVTPVITLLYAGILGLFSVVVASAPGQLRGKLGISVGDGGNQELLLAMRKHANFIENVPLALIIIGLMEMNGGPATAIHVLGAALVVTRILHFTGLKGDTMAGFGRFFGAAGGALITVVASIWSIVLFF